MSVVSAEEMAITFSITASGARASVEALHAANATGLDLPWRWSAVAFPAKGLNDLRPLSVWISRMPPNLVRLWSLSVAR